MSMPEFVKNNPKLLMVGVVGVFVGALVGLTTLLILVAVGAVLWWNASKKK